jgi:arylsulfatase A
VNGKKLIGKKGTMQEGGSLVPLIANWPGVTPKGVVSKNLIDASDFIPTFAEIAGAPLPANIKLDGTSFAKQLKGSKEPTRTWIFTELGNDWYVREANWKLNRAGELFDMSNAPFQEKLTAIDEKTKPIKDRLQGILDSLNPGAGILDKGDGTGRHANKAKKKAKS